MATPSTTEPGVDPDLLAALAARLPEWMADRRWFADKHLGTPTLSIADAAAVELGSGLLLLPIVHVGLNGAGSSRYFVPLLLASSRHATEPPIFEVEFDGHVWQVHDAVATVLGPWIVERIARNDSLPTLHGSISGIAVGNIPPKALEEPCTASAAEQSNSSIVYQTMIAKVYRRLHQGLNPDVEVGRHFAKSNVLAAPRLLGSLEYETAEGHFTLAMLQEKIRNPEDAWKLVTESLRDRTGLAEIAGARLGELTAAMHEALASRSGNPSFDPELATVDEAAVWKSQSRHALASAVQALAERIDELGPVDRQLAQRFIAQSDAVADRLEGYSELVDYPLIRVHGDYHLGQVLLSGEGEWFVVDFEGEPRRPIDDRIRKTSPLKDVAGMLRSFAYARGVALRESSPADRQYIETWERRTRENYLSTYLQDIRSAMPSLLPPDDEAVRRAITAWETDKALYEALYELASRPNWLWLPLSSIVEGT